MTAATTRLLAALLGVGMMGGLALVAVMDDTAPVSAQTGPTTTLEEGLEGNLGRMIPRPNSGREPESPGDRGGWLQLTVMGVMVGGLIVIGGLVIRESRRSRAADSSGS